MAKAFWPPMGARPTRPDAPENLFNGLIRVRILTHRKDEFMHCECGLDLRMIAIKALKQGILI